MSSVFRFGETRLFFGSQKFEFDAKFGDPAQEDKRWRRRYYGQQEGRDRLRLRNLTYTQIVLRTQNLYVVF